MWWSLGPGGIRSARPPRPIPPLLPSSDHDVQLVRGEVDGGIVELLASVTRVRECRHRHDRREQHVVLEAHLTAAHQQQQGGSAKWPACACRRFAARAPRRLAGPSLCSHTLASLSFAGAGPSQRDRVAMGWDGQTGLQLTRQIGLVKKREQREERQTSCICPISSSDCLFSSLTSPLLSCTSSPRTVWSGSPQFLCCRRRPHRRTTTPTTRDDHHHTHADDAHTHTHEHNMSMDMDQDEHVIQAGQVRVPQWRRAAHRVSQTRGSLRIVDGAMRLRQCAHTPHAR